MFASLPSVDWNVAAAAAATFIVTAIATVAGFRKGKKKVESEGTTSVQLPVAGGVLMDNMSMMMLSEALKEVATELRAIHPCLIEIKVVAQMAAKKD